MTEEMERPDKPRVLGMLNTIAWIIDQAEKTGYITEQEKREYFKVNRMIITRIGNTKIEHEEDNPVAPPEETEKQRIERERITEYIRRKGAPVLAIEITAILMNTTVDKIKG